MRSGDGVGIRERRRRHRTDIRHTTHFSDRTGEGDDHQHPPSAASAAAEAVVGHDAGRAATSRHGDDSTAVPPGARASVLVVDDEPDVRDSIAAVLQGSGFAVTSAVDGHDALRALEESTVDVMVLDVRMPRLSGLALLDLLEEPPAVVVVSADPVDAATRARLGAKVHRYLAKPFDPRELVDAVRSAGGD